MSVDASPRPNALPQDPIKVLYILGVGRSGSTLLDTLLNELEGFFSMGELRALWADTLPNDRRCGCGVAVSRCPVWVDVLDGAVTNWRSPATVRRLRHAQRAVVRQRHLPLLLRSNHGDGPQTHALQAIASAQAAILRGVARVTDAQVIVDSSKIPADAALLATLPGIDLYVLHLVRDPRAVAYSWSRPKPRGDGPDPTESLPRYSSATSTRKWVEFNLCAHLIARKVGPSHYLRVRYEDLLRDPPSSLQRIVTFVGASGVNPPVAGSTRTVSLGTNHTVSGNPARFQRGVIELREDTRWRVAQPLRDALTVSLLSAPLMFAYGYDLAPPIQRTKIRSRGRS